MNTQVMTPDGPKGFGEDAEMVEIEGSNEEQTLDVTIGAEADKGEGTDGVKVDVTAAEGEQPPADGGGEPDERGQMGQRAQKRIKSLSYHLHQQRTATEEAEKARAETLRMAQALKAENEQLRRGVTQTNESYLDTMAERHTARLDSLRKDLANALTAGDSETAAKLQADMALVGGELATINQTKIAHKASNPAPQQQQPQQPQQQQQPQYQAPQPQQQTQQPKTDLHPKTTSWLNSNANWFNKLDDEQSAAKTRTAFQIHDDLIAEGFSGADDDYYVELDERLREKFPDHKVSAMTSGNDLSGDGDGSQAKTPAANPQTPALSPYSRQNGSGGGARTVRLSPTQVALAKSLGLTVEEYAKSVAEGT